MTRYRARFFQQNDMDPYQTMVVQMGRNLQAIALQWLATSRAPIAPIANGRLEHVENSFNSVNRRNSIACGNVYSVDGSIQEVGFDHLPHVPYDDVGDSDAIDADDSHAAIAVQTATTAITATIATAPNTNNEVNQANQGNEIA